MLTEQQIKKLTQKQAAAVTDKNDAILIVTNRPSLFEKMPNWQDDKDVAMAAIKRFAFCIECVSDRLRDDEELVLLAMQQNPRLLMEASKRLSDSDKMRKIAFVAYGSAFIVDKLAWKEFERLDSKLRRDTTEYKEQPDGEIIEVFNEKKMDNNSFYRLFKKFYHHVPSDPVTADDIRAYEEYLLNVREQRLKKGVEKRPLINSQNLKTDK